MIRPFKIEQGYGKDSGQTLLLAIFCMVILLFLIFFLFDLQNVIRAKLKSRNAVDAAALVGANWQRYSLNMIGDINLIKASTFLIADVTPGDHNAIITTKNQADLLHSYATNLTDLQRRISFVGPLIGVGAMQQAAKANGVAANEMFAMVLEDHIGMLYDNEMYLPPNTPLLYDKFFWRPSYTHMIEQLYCNGLGLAVAPNVDLLMTPKLRTSTDVGNFLTQKEIIKAIASNNWCVLKNLLRCDFSGSAWYGTFNLDYEQGSFLGMSEYLPLYLYANYACMTHKTETCNCFPTHWNNSIINNNQLLDAYLKEKKLEKIDSNHDHSDPHVNNSNPLNPIRDITYDPLRRLSFFCFDNQKWQSYDRQKINDWKTLLRSDIKEEYQYEGAHSYAYTELKPVGKASSIVPPPNIIPKAANQNGLSDNKELLSYLEPINVTATAKPLGYLQGKNSFEKPFKAANIVLPCFDRSVLIPVPLEPEDGLNPFDYEWYCFLTEYLPALGSCGSIDEMGPDKLPDPEHWGMFAYYHSCLIKLNNPEWRQTGLEWLDTPILDKEGNQIGIREDNCYEPPPGGNGGGTEGPFPPQLH